MNFLMINVYIYFNRHSLDIMNDIFKLRERFYIFQPKKPGLWGLGAIPNRTSQLWQQIFIDIHKMASLALLGKQIKTWKCEDFP